MEYWDLYDKDRKPLHRTIMRGEQFGEGEYYVCCEVCIANKDGKFLITRRHPSKWRGGMWEFTGGGVLAGETTLQGAMREVAEEIGIYAEESQFTYLITYTNKNYFMDVYLLKEDVILQNLHLQESEVTETKLADKKEIQQMVLNGEFVKSEWERFLMYENELTLALQM